MIADKVKGSKITPTSKSIAISNRSRSGRAMIIDALIRELKRRSSATTQFRLKPSGGHQVHDCDGSASMIFGPKSCDIAIAIVGCTRYRSDLKTACRCNRHSWRCAVVHLWGVLVSLQLCCNACHGWPGPSGNAPGVPLSPINVGCASASVFDVYSTSRRRWTPVKSYLDLPRDEVESLQTSRSLPPCRRGQPLP